MTPGEGPLIVPIDSRMGGPFLFPGGGLFPSVMISRWCSN